jgi:hypothetical protein
VGLLAVSALALGGIFVWLGVRNLASVEDLGGPKTHFAETAPNFSASENSLAPGSQNRRVPDQFLKPEEVLSEAEMMRGPIYGRGFVQSGSDSVSVLDAQAILRRGRTEIEVAFFGAVLSEEEKTELQSRETFEGDISPAPLLRAKIALSPFGSDCSVVNVKSYAVVAGVRTLSRIGSDPGATELRKLSCQRKKGELLELSFEGAFPAENTKGKVGLGESKWSVEARVPLS